MHKIKTQHRPNQTQRKLSFCSKKRSNSTFRGTKKPAELASFRPRKRAHTHQKTCKTKRKHAIDCLLGPGISRKEHKKNKKEVISPDHRASQSPRNAVLCLVHAVSLVEESSWPGGKLNWFKSVNSTACFNFLLFYLLNYFDNSLWFIF